MFRLWEIIQMISKSIFVKRVLRRWREERKRKYPTQQNIEKKMTAKETVEQAGGLVEHEDKRVDETPHFTYVSVRI